MLTLMLLQLFHAFRPRNLVLTFHGSEILKFYHNPLIRPMARRLMHYALRISVLTEYSRGLLTDLFPEAAKKTITSPGALRSDFIPPRQSRSSAKERIIILTVARLHPRKGQLQTMQALAGLPASVRHNIEYWIVGSTARPTYEKELRKTAQSVGYSVVFKGEVDDRDLGRIYNDADLFVMTSLDHGKSVEGFGLVYLEASAHGLPVVAHSVGGVAEAVVDNQTGLLVPPHDLEALTSALQRLIADPQLRSKLGEKGREWARRHTWSESAGLIFGSPQS